MRFFTRVEPAEFISRPNRFLVRCRKDREEITAFLPNPGRLQELLLPRRRLYLTREQRSNQRKYPYTVIGVEREGFPIMLHTHKTNEVARFLIDRGRIPGLEGARVIGKEVPVGHSRFDLLLEYQGRPLLTEVKSCTLFGEKIAMFPDAVTERGTRHLRELAGLAEAGRETAVILVVHWPKADYFLPDYHTDLFFARTMLECREKIRFFPIALRWKEDFSLDAKTALLPIPWKSIDREAQDRGSYLLLLRLEKRKSITIGKMGEVLFQPGYYLYVGSAMKNLTARLERHRRLRKTHHWHIDYLRQEAAWVAALPVRSSAALECTMAAAMEKIADGSVPGFGSSDCSCPSHLFGMESNPFHSQKFIDWVQYFRMDRLYPMLNKV
ncbi:MAG: DNA/RNA nuclease SfsA [Thermodesulfobacteriota bacterium]